MLRYTAASRFWRMIPAGLSDRVWHRRGWSLLQRAARWVPAYGQLLEIFQGQPGPSAAAGRHTHRLQTCRHSYVDVYPLRYRCCSGWQSEAITFDPDPCSGAPPGAAGHHSNWPRSRYELSILRQQLVGLLSGWFDARRRRTLLVLDLPAAGWAGAPRIGRALQEAIGLGHLSATLVDRDSQDDDRGLARLADAFQQCIVLTRPGDVAERVDWLASQQVRSGIVCFGPPVSGFAAGAAGDVAVCSVLGADEVGPLIAAETPLSRLAAAAMRMEAVNGDAGRVLGAWQPFPCGPWIEQEGCDLLVSSWGAAPVLRYRLGWCGRIVPFEQIRSVLRGTTAPPGNRLRGGAPWKLPLIVLSQA